MTNFSVCSKESLFQGLKYSYFSRRALSNTAVLNFPGEPLSSEWLIFLHEEKEKNTTNATAVLAWFEIMSPREGGGGAGGHVRLGTAAQG